MSFLMAVCCPFVFVLHFCTFLLFYVYQVSSHSFFIQFLQKIFFLLFPIQPLVSDVLIPHQRRAWNTVVISYPIILYHIQSWVSSQNYVNSFLLLCTTLYHYFCATTYSYIFVRSASYIIIIGRNSLRKCNLDVQNPCLTRRFAVIFLAHFYT